MNCPNADSILAFVGGNLSATERLALAAHLDACESCLALVAGAAGESIGAGFHRPGAGRLAKGTSVGRYVLIDLVGSGGMGDVYAAQDPKLGRRVAVKVMNDRVASPVLAVRFAREAQAIARLSHPNVVAIYDAGEFENRGYLAMEYVEGCTLTDWLAVEPRTWRQIRDVFMAAGRGLAAAHEAGLVHRDFKPANVMVGRDGSVRVMDFGLAADVSEVGTRDLLLDEVGDSPAPTPSTLALTRDGVLLGTPLYMAPEQFLGRETEARTDQFSFCVSLYEALYGERPFASDSHSTLLDSVVHGRVREPSQRTRAPSFVRKLIFRGLAVSPDLRFPSMSELLDTLRYDPARRWGRIAVTAAAAVLMVAVVAAGHRFTTRHQRICQGASERLAGIWEVDPEGQRRNAVHNAFLATGRTFAEDTWKRVSILLDDYSRRWSETYSDVCEATHVRGDQPLQMLELRMGCLEGPRGALKALTDVLSKTDPAVLVEAVNSAHALPELDRCSDVLALESAVPLPADAATRIRVTALRKDLADVKALADTGQLLAAQRSMQPLVDTIAALGYTPLFVDALATNAWLEMESGAPAKAAELYGKVVWPALSVHRDDIATESVAMLVSIDGYYLGHTQEADNWTEAGEALLRRLGPGHDRIAAWFYQGRADSRDRKGEYQAALADMDIALTLKRRALGSHHPDTAKTLYGIANVRNEVGDYEGALAKVTEAVESYREAYGSASPLLTQPLEIRGETLNLLGRHAEAERDLRRAVDLSIAWVGANHVWTSYPMTGLGEVLIAEHRFQEATSILEKALRIRKESEPNSEPVAETEFALAQALRGSGREEARSKALATIARDAYRNLPAHGKQVAEIDVWLGALPEKFPSPAFPHGLSTRGAPPRSRPMLTSPWARNVAGVE